MRFDSARAAGLAESQAALVEDGYAARLPAPAVAALQLTDALLGQPAPPTAEQQQLLLEHYTAAEILELALGVGLFHGMSKVLINLGLEPEQMPVTLLPTPGS
ncbi:MAG: hypothetical protein AB8B93_03135 [Pseudomonadales bacterium]